MSRVGVIILLVIVLCVGARASWVRDGVRLELRAEMSPTNIVGSGAAAGAVVSNDVIYLDVPDLSGRVAGLEAEDGDLWASVNENRDNIYLVEFRRMAGDSAALGEMIGGVVDVFEDTSGVDGAASSNATLGASGYGFVAFTPSSGTDYTNSLVARWRLGENGDSATVMDDIGGIPGALKQGSGSDGLPGVDACTSGYRTNRGANAALYFGHSKADYTKTDTYVETSNTFSSVFEADFTIMAWAAPHDPMAQTPGGHMAIFGNEQSNYSPNYGGFMVWATCHYVESIGGTVGWSFSGDGSYTFSGNNTYGTVWPLGDSSWHHVAMTWDESESTFAIFVDGASYSSAQVGATCKPSKGGQTLHIGDVNDPNGGGHYTFWGGIGNVQVFDRILTVEEVSQAMSNSVPASGGAINLQSLPQYASSAPAEARGMVLLDTSNSVNSEVWADVSSDGVAWDRLTLADLGPYSGSIRIYGATTNLTGAGTGMVYRVQSSTSASGTVRGAAIMWR